MIRPAVYVVLLMLVAPVAAQTTQPAARSDKLATTEHQVTVDGKALRYRATAGYLPARDEAGKEKANYFYIAYEKLEQDPRTRPVTFVFNGGPGAASVWMHLGTAGPMRIGLADDAGEAPAPPYKLVENESTWLDATDLVFIDPIGTGFSRPAPGEKAEAHYGLQEDIQSVATFIRLYITHNQRWLSPKFLAGESYGTTRAAALSEYLADRHGIALNGVILISVVLDFQTIQVGEAGDLPYVLYLPSYTAIAWHHRRLDQAMQKDLDATLAQVRHFAMDEYLVALAKGDSLEEEARKAVAGKLSRFTGLSEASILKSNLRIGPGFFRDRLLEDQRLILGRFDARITGYNLSPVTPFADYDPSLTRYLALYSATFNHYVRQSLGFESELPYEVLSDKVHPWNWGQSRGTGGFVNVTGDLRGAMAKLPSMRVMFASGLFDLATPFMGAEYTVDHLNLSPALRKNVRMTYYRGGHMMYHEAGSRRKLKEDVAGFIAWAAGARP